MSDVHSLDIKLRTSTLPAFHLFFSLYLKHFLLLFLVINKFASARAEQKKKVLAGVKVEILRLLTEELRGINSKAVYARKEKYDLYGRKVLRIVFPRKQINILKGI